MKTITFILACCASLWAQTESVPMSIGAAEAGRVVGKPYSATQVMHAVQTLANGSHIERTTTTLVYQDDQGRFRREMTDGPRQVVIYDPVANVNYNILIEQKTARKMQMRPAGVAAAQKIAGDVSPFEEARAVRPGANNLVEDLGSQFINGVAALGVRMTNTIPLGAIGNDQELKSVTERWFSNDIHAVVRIVSTDPRSGVNTVELTNIVRSAPDPALFQVPAGFTVTTLEIPAPPVVVKKD